MSLNEQFNFENSPFFWHFAAGSTTINPGTTNISIANPEVRQNLLSNLVNWEPSETAATGRVRLDANTRVVVLASRLPGVLLDGPTATLRFNRAPGTGNAWVVNLGEIRESADAVPQIFDGVMPANLGSVNATPSLSSTIKCELFVTTTEANVHIVGCTVLMVPSLRGAQATNRGNILSGPGYY